MIDLSIVVVSFGTRELTIDCIKSILKNTKNINFEIIVVDNSSIDDSVDQLKKLKSNKVKLIVNSKNLGFAAANNSGIKSAKGKYILLLNSDTIIHDNVLTEMTSWMNDNEKVGIATCSLINKDKSIQATGGFFPSLFKVFAWMTFVDDIPFLTSNLKAFHPHTPDFKGNSKLYLSSHELDWVTGAFLLVRSEVVEKIGEMDEDYFMYTEEVDFCYRAKLAGWKVWFLPKWKITHLGGASGSNEFSILQEYKGVKRFYRKFYPKWQYPLLRLFLKLGALIRLLVFSITKRKEAKIYAKAFIQA